jgi:hypothetical protein
MASVRYGCGARYVILQITFGWMLVPAKVTCGYGQRWRGNMANGGNVGESGMSGFGDPSKQTDNHTKLFHM